MIVFRATFKRVQIKASTEQNCELVSRNKTKLNELLLSR